MVKHRRPKKAAKQAFRPKFSRLLRRFETLGEDRALQGYLSLALIAIVALGLALDWVYERSRTDLAAPEMVPPSKIETPVPFSPERAWNYFHPVWNAEGRSLFPIRNSSQARNAQAVAEVEAVVSDPDGRIESDFKTPAYLRDRVIFWMQVHARFNSRMRLVHDRYNPGIIYGYIDFRPLFRVLGTTSIAEAKTSDIEKKILAELKEKIREAADISKSNSLSSTERSEIRSYLSSVGALSPVSAASLVEGVRTQTGQSDEFLAALNRSRNLLPHIESVFRQQGLPIALARIPFVESSFNARALSKVGAVGIWQFMPQTARQMISKNDTAAWGDPLKQTNAAAKMLKMFRRMLPDWGTSVTSYNSGVGRLKRLVQKYNARTLEKIIDESADDGLGFAGKNFYAQFLSANLVEAYKEELFGDLLYSADSSLVLNGIIPVDRLQCGF